MSRPIRIAILADGARARRELDGVARSGSRAGQLLAKAGRVAATGLAVGLGAAVYAAKEFAQSAAADETAAALLERQLRASAKATDVQVASTERWITAQGKATGVTDDELRPALAKLVTATEDIGEAQKLASLAMDVSAARGKSLETVSVAIAKAQDGQITGLSRLGVETKNAAGETLTFTELVRKMGSQFGGAAATKAETLQGRIDRLKVRATEAGEALGAKLLPPLADLAEEALDAAPAIEGFLNTEVAPKLRDASKWYKANRDDLGELVSIARDEAGPILADLASVVADVATEFVQVAGPLAGEVLPALGQLASLGSSAVGAIGGLPGPLQTIASGAGLAALTLPRLNSGLSSVTGSLTTGTAGFTQWISAARVAETRSTAFGIAALKMGDLAKNAAGPAGIGALILAAAEGESALGSFAGVAGGAAVGFSLGGPIGAIIGGAGAGLIGAFRALDDARSEAVQGMGQSKPQITDFASTLDEVTAAATGATRSLALQSLQQRGALEAGASLGLNQRTLVDALLGRKDAQEKLQGAIDKYSNAEVLAASQSDAYYASLGAGRPVLTKAGEATLEQARAAGLLASSIQTLTPQLRAQQRETRNNAIATQDLTALFPQLRKGAIAKIQALGTEASVRDVLRLNRTMKLTPKQLITALRVSGAVDSERAAKRVVRGLQDLDRTKVTLPGVRAGVQKGTAEAAGAAQKGGRDVRKGLEDQPKRARADLSVFGMSIRTGVGPAKSAASTGGREVGANLKAGVIAGFSGTLAQLSAMAAAAVRAAVAAAKREGKIKSPSKETEYLGRMLGDGLVLGMAKKGKDAKNGGKDLIAAALEGVTGGSEGVESSLEKLLKIIDRTFTRRLAQTRKRLDKKLDGKALDKAVRQAEAANEKAQKRVLKRTAELRAAIRANGKEQDKANEKLEEARQSLQGLVDQAKAYADTVRDAVVGSGSLSTLAQGDGFASIDDLIRKRTAAVERAKVFAQTINALTRAGLNATDIQDLIAQGVEGGLGTAQALLAEGPTAIAQMNSLAAQLNATGTQLGTDTANTLYGAGIQAAQGLVDGLAANPAALDQAAAQLAKKLAKAVKKALGIKSPSRVFMDIGKQTVRGLALGLDDVYVRRQGQQLASSLEKGFGTPALDAYLSAGSAGEKATVELKLTAQQIDAMQRGEAIQADLDFYRANGGRARA